MQVNRILVDANVLLDVMTDDPQWYGWSAERLDACAAEAELYIMRGGIHQVRAH